MNWKIPGMRMLCIPLFTIMIVVLLFKISFAVTFGEAMDLANAYCAKRICGCTSPEVEPGNTNVLQVCVIGTKVIAVNGYMETVCCTSGDQNYGSGCTGWVFENTCSDPSDKCCSNPTDPCCGSNDPCCGNPCCGDVCCQQN